MPERPGHHVKSREVRYERLKYRQLERTSSRPITQPNRLNKAPSHMTNHLDPSPRWITSTQHPRQSLRQLTLVLDKSATPNTMTNHLHQTLRHITSTNQIDNSPKQITWTNHLESTLKKGGGFHQQISLVWIVPKSEYSLLIRNLCMTSACVPSTAQHSNAVFQLSALTLISFSSFWWSG